MSRVIYIFLCDKLVELDGGGSVINEAYLVYFILYRFINRPCIDGAILQSALLLVD